MFWRSCCSKTDAGLIESLCLDGLMDVLVTLDVVEGQAHLKTPAETDAGLIDSLVS